MILALMVSPAWADMYKCGSGNRTVYQDVPCPDVRVMNRLDSEAPSPREQDQAIDRAARERALLTELTDAREARDRMAVDTPNKSKPRPVRAAPAAKRPDKYYDRPDRYYGRPDRYDNRAVNNARPLRSR
jgi:hypothetical protein